MKVAAIGGTVLLIHEASPGPIHHQNVKCTAAADGLAVTWQVRSRYVRPSLSGPRAVEN